MKLLKNLLAPTLSLIAFALLFEVWRIDFSLPTFNYNNDGLFYLFVIKNIIDTGWFINNPNLGLPHFSEIFNIYDFPLQADLFQILIIKFFTLFSNNPFLVANCFFITTFILISLSSFVVLRSFNISVFTATIISILYVFLPYHFVRNIWHLFLSNYAVVPLAIMVALWIADDKLEVLMLNKKGQYSISPNKFFLIAAIVALFIAISGVYYAYYSIIVFVFAWILRSLKNQKFLDKNSLAAVVLCGMMFVVLLCLYFPTFLYQQSHGFNGHVATRGTGDSEFFALRIINLLLPIENHYWDYFSNITGFFGKIVSDETERSAANLGLIGSFGFMFLLMWLIGKNFDSNKNSVVQKTIKRFSLKSDEQNLMSNLAVFNILSVLFATSGGLVMLVSLAFPLLRSHARFSVFIAFISLFAVAVIFDKIAVKRKITTYVALILLTVFGVLDQVGKVSSLTVQSSAMKSKFANDRNFIAEIEKSLPEQAMIFVLPAYSFPEAEGDDYGSLITYIHSKNLRWSYPAMAGRESSNWQQKIIKEDFKTFVAAIKQEGFSGVYLDRAQYFATYGSQKLITLEKNLRSVALKPEMISQNARLVFFEI